MLFHRLIDGHRIEGKADGQEAGHLIRLIDHEITEVLALRYEAAHSGDVAQGIGESANGVLETAHHHVGETDVVSSGDVASRHLMVHLLNEKGVKLAMFIQPL